MNMGLSTFISVIDTLTEAVVWRCAVKKVSLKFRKIHKKTYVSESLF